MSNPFKSYQLKHPSMKIDAVKVTRENIHHVALQMGMRTMRDGVGPGGDWEIIDRHGLYVAQEGDFVFELGDTGDYDTWSGPVDFEDMFEEAK